MNPPGLAELHPRIASELHEPLAFRVKNAARTSLRRHRRVLAHTFAPKPPNPSLPPLTSTKLRYVSNGNRSCSRWGCPPALHLGVAWHARLRLRVPHHDAQRISQVPAYGFGSRPSASPPSPWRSCPSSSGNRRLYRAVPRTSARPRGAASARPIPARYLTRGGSR